MKLLLGIILSSIISQGIAQSKDYEFKYQMSNYQKSESKYYLASAILDFELINHTSDTLFYFTYTCDGEVYGIEANDKDVSATAFVLCNANYPCVCWVPPGDTMKMSCELIFRKKVKEFNLTFQLVTVNRRFRNLSGKISANHYILSSHQDQEIKSITRTIPLTGPTISVPK